MGGFPQGDITCVNEDLFALGCQLTVNIFHDEAWLKHDQSAVNVRRSGFLLNMERMDNEAVGFEFSVEPFDGSSVSGH